MAERSAQPFPIRGGVDGRGIIIPPSVIPNWLAEYAWAQYAYHHGEGMSVNRWAEAGGWGVEAFLDFLAFGNGNGDAMRFCVRNRGMRSIKSQVQIVVPGTGEYADAMREVRAEEAARRADKKNTRISFGPGGASGGGQSAGRR